MRHRWRDGTTGMLFEPGELIEKLVALVPAPRGHLVRYHGVLAPHARWRAQVVGDRREEQGPEAEGSPHAWFENRGPRCMLIVFIDDASRVPL